MVLAQEITRHAATGLRAQPPDCLCLSRIPSMAPNPDPTSPPPNPTRQAKKDLRKRCRQLRDDLGEAARSRAGAEICRRIRHWDGFPATGVVFTYLPFHAEIDLRPLIAVSPAAVRWAIPRVIEQPVRRLAFHLYDPDRLVPHRYGMLEPDPGLPELAPEQASLILVPGLAFTSAGHRLGYGAGYYDRLLSLPGHAPSLGPCYQALLLDSLPHEAHDAPVDFIVTEQAGVFASHQTG